MLLLIYNIMLAAVDLLIVGLIRHKRSLVVWAGSMAGFGGIAVIGVLLAKRWGDDYTYDEFHTLQLLSAAIFIHGVLLLVASAVIFWRHQRWASMGFATVAATMLLVAFDAWVVEPTWLEVSKIRIVSPKLDRPVRVVVIADLQTDGCGDYERRALQLAAEQKPDVLLFAGDYVQAPSAEKPAIRADIRAVLQEINYRPPLGAYAVLGNVDGHGWTDMFDDTGIETVAKTTTFDLGPLRLTCLSLNDSYRTNLALPASPETHDAFHITLGHVPNFALSNIKADLLLAGHTHGGQVQLPLIGPIVTNSRLPRSWASGVTHRPQGGTLIVSRGIGMERGAAPEIRFFCRPQLLVLDLTPQ